MRLRHIALGCTLTGALGCLMLSSATARADIQAPGKASRTTPKLTISAPSADSNYRSKIKLTVSLGPTFTNRKVSLYAKPDGQARKLVATGRVNAKGKWYPDYTITWSTKFTVAFAGDSRYAATTASTAVQAYAKVADRIGGFYTTQKVGKITYDVFHGSGTLTLYSAVSPAKPTQCLEPETQQLDGKTWDADTKYGCDQLTAASQDTAPFSLNMAVGDHYRIRGDYYRSSKDHNNLNDHGSWLYFEVVK